MIPYILQVTVIITACFLFYKLMLRKETFFRLNRWILMVCLLISFSLPFLPVPRQWSWQYSYGSALAKLTSSAAPIPPSSAIVTTPASGSAAETPQQKSTSSTSAGTGQSSVATVPSPYVTGQATESGSGEPLLNRLLKGGYYLYLFGVILFGLNLLLQIAVLLLQSYTQPAVRDGRYRIVETSGNRAPCSFGNNIFINPSQYDWDTYNQILLHEKIHVSQRHTLDIFLAELLLVFQWFNPFAWFYRKEVENNLEFLTDRSLLLDSEIEPSTYQLSLLKVSAPHFPLGVTTNYNQSLLKRRIVMMNSKHSSPHTVWKYFFLLPLLTGLVCALNKPAAYGQSTRGEQITEEHSHSHNEGGNATTEGAWFATTKKDKLCFEFKSGDDDRTWSNNTCIARSELTGLDGVGKVSFQLVRESGTMSFTGQFDGEQGYGHYSFKADPAYISFMKDHEVSLSNDNNLLAFFMLDIRKDYVQMIHDNGYPHVSVNNLIAMTAMHIDREYIHGWKEMGFTDISENDLIAAKAMNIDRAYVEDMQKAGYEHLPVDKLIAFKAQGIDGAYVRKLRAAGLSGDGAAAGAPAAPVPSAGAPVPAPAPVNVISPLPEADQMIAFKALKIDSDYVAGLRAVDYSNIPMQDLVTLRSLDITPDFIKSFAAIGYLHPDIQSLITLKSLNITPAYIKGFQDIGFDIVPIEVLPSLKSLDITPAYIKSFQDIGYKHLSLEALPALKSTHVTADYIKGFQAVGYTDIPLGQLPALKALNITPDFIQDYQKIGFKNIPLGELTALKSLGVTPEYVQKMKAKGFVSDDLGKYMQLKSSFNNFQ